MHDLMDKLICLGENWPQQKEEVEVIGKFGFVLTAALRMRCSEVRTEIRFAGPG
jgi:hypothetical protein